MRLNIRRSLVLAHFKWASSFLFVSAMQTTLAYAQSAGQPQSVVLGEPGWGTGFGVEPFAGRLRFAREMKLEDSDIFGARAGLYLGRSMRLRGYYWRGTDSISTSSAPTLKSYGGELEIGTMSGWFIHPFLIAGGGLLDYAKEFKDSDSVPRTDQTVWVAGAGLRVRPVNWFDANISYRDNLLKPLLRDKWVHNEMWTAGVSFRFGGIPRKQQSVVYGSAGATSSATAPARGTAAGSTVNMAMVPVPVNGGEIRVVYNGDTLRVTESGQLARTMATGTVPVEAIRDLVSSELAYLNALYPVPFGTKRTALSPDQADSLTRRLGVRINGVLDYLLRGQAEAMREAMKTELTMRGVDQAAQTKILARMDSSLSERLTLNAQQSHTIMVRDDSAYARRAREAAEADRRTVTAGVGGFSQLYLDGRVSFRSPWREQLRLVPEVALGFGGGGVSALVTGNALYYVSSGSTKPYVGLGLGVLVRGSEIGGKTGTSFVLNPSVGVEFSSPSARRFGQRALGYFAELQGVDLFSNTRVLAGITWKY